jgi:SnoaL-like domain/Clp amino terminal domain, pathogenicity island component
MVGHSAPRNGGAPPFTPRAKKVLELSLREALARGSARIGTEHILFGLLAMEAQEEGVVTTMLTVMGTDAERLRRLVEDALAGVGPDVEGPGLDPDVEEPGAGRGTIERYFEHLTARDWEALGQVLAPDVDRVGPLGDRVSGRDRYLTLLAGAVPEDYGNDVHLIVYAPGGRSGFARVTEHLGYPDRELHLEEAYAFHLDETGRVRRVEVFWQMPPSDMERDHGDDRDHQDPAAGA